MTIKENKELDFGIKCISETFENENVMDNVLMVCSIQEIVIRSRRALSFLLKKIFTSEYLFGNESNNEMSG